MEFVWLKIFMNTDESLKLTKQECLRADGDIQENYQICDGWWQTAADVLGCDSDQFVPDTKFVLLGCVHHEGQNMYNWIPVQ